MIISFYVSNFKSFNDETSISMVSSSKIQEGKDHLYRLNRLSILKNCVLYGANAAGKSNFITAIDFMKHIVLNGMPINTANLFCKNDQHNAQKNSKFEIIIEKNNKIYAYGFEVFLKDSLIKKEWLYELHQDNSSTLIFENNHSKIILGKSFISKEDDSKWKVYSEDFEGQDKTLFLTEINRNKKLSNKMKLFVDVFQFFLVDLVIIKPDQPLPGLEVYNDASTIERIGELLNSFDTGISKIMQKKLSEEELSKRIPAKLLKDFYSTIESNPNKKIAAMTMRSHKDFINVRFDAGRIDAYTICMKHGKSVLDFDYCDESDGTRRIIELVDMIFSKKTDTVYLVDELERSLHPRLTERFLKTFGEEHKNKKTQLIFTTHDNALMDSKLFRRDEIWFVERNEKNDSKFYSLDRFKLRSDKKISKDYLEGRYGAVPIFKTFNIGED